MPSNPNFDEIFVGPRFKGDKTLRERVLDAKDNAVRKQEALKRRAENQLMRLDRDASWGCFPNGSYDGARASVIIAVRGGAAAVEKLTRLARSAEIKR